MKATTIESKSEWRFFNLACEDVEYTKTTFDIGLYSFLSRLFYGDVGNVNSYHVEVLLRKPDCVIASPASDIECLTGSNGRCGHGVNEVEVRLSYVPRSLACLVMLLETLLWRHGVSSMLQA